MKVLVTGGAGFIGSHVVDGLLAAGHEVVIVDDLTTGRRSNLNPAARFYEVGLGDPELGGVFARERPEVVDHHAAQISVRYSVDDPLRDARINILGTINLLENCHRYGVRKVIYASSGGAVYGTPEYLPCDERHPVNPDSPYGASKHTVEHYLYLYQQLYGLPYSALRYPNVYGPRQDPLGEAGVVAIFIGQMLRNERVTINGTGEQQRDFIYVGDLVSANLAALQKGDGGIYNLGTGVGTSVNEIFAHLKEIIDYPPAANYGPAKLGETFRIYLDATLAQRELGWRQEVDLRTGLGKTVAYFRAHPEEIAVRR